MFSFKNADKVTVIGDVHGCLPTLEKLLNRIDKDMPLIFIGDIINRGPQSLETLRLIRSLGKQARVILGNHDMHFLATAAGNGKANRRDTIAEIFKAPDAQELIDWMRHQRLMYRWKEYTFVHAAIDPAWSIKEADELAGEVHDILRSKHWKDALKEMYGKDLWDPKLKGSARMRAILNGFTRIRFVDKKGVPDYKAKESPQAVGADLMPWFDYPNRKTANDTIVFGHWSTLGLILRPHIIALDTGCIWGGSLTAIELPSRRIIQEKAPQYLDPLA